MNTLTKSHQTSSNNINGSELPSKKLTSWSKIKREELQRLNTSPGVKLFALQLIRDAESALREEGVTMTIQGLHSPAGSVCVALMRKSTSLSSGE